MFITTKITWNAAGQVICHEGFEYDGPLALACGPSGGEKAMANQERSLSATMVSQAKDVFGKDSAAFNQIAHEYGDIIGQGPNQMGFSEAELNALRSSAITSNAQQFRNVAGAVKNAQATIGGGNAPTNAGVTDAQQLAVANAAASNTARQLTDIDIANYNTGRENFWRAGAGLEAAPSMFDNVPKMNEAASESTQAAFKEQQDLSAQSNWWQKPVMSLASDLVSAGTAGLGSAIAGKGFTSAFGNALQKG